MRRARTAVREWKAPVEVPLAGRVGIGAVPIRLESIVFDDRNEVCQSFAFFPSRPNARIRISEPSKRSVNEFLGGRSAATAALFVK
jgi:hypothetical protein